MKALLIEPNAHPILVNTDFKRMKSYLNYSFITFAYPYDDPVALVHDDDGIANNLPPKHTIGNQTMPGPFFVVQVTDDGGMCDLEERFIHKYMYLFWDPEDFGEGEWKLNFKSYESGGMMVFATTSEWVPKPSVSDRSTADPSHASVSDRSTSGPSTDSDPSDNHTVVEDSTPSDKQTVDEYVVKVSDNQTIVEETDEDVNETESLEDVAKKDVVTE